MKKITASMYEELALDYLEGRLSGEGRVAFERYLEQDVRAASDIEALRHFMPTAAAEPVLYPGMEALLRGPKFSPWRKVASLLGGAAAAASIVACLMLIGKGNESANPMAEAPAHSEHAAVEAPVTEPPSAPASQIASTDRPAEPAPAEALAARADAAAKATGVQPAQPSAQPKSAPSTEPAAAPARAADPMPTESDGELIEPVFSLPEDAFTPILADFDPALREEGSDETSPRSESLNHKIEEFTPLTPIGSLLGRVGLIKAYETDEGRGVEIASLIRIGRRNTEHEKADN